MLNESNRTTWPSYVFVLQKHCANNSRTRKHALTLLQFWFRTVFKNLPNAATADCCGGQVRTVSWVELVALFGLRRAVALAEDLPSHKKRCRDGFYSYRVVVEVVEIERRS